MPQKICFGFLKEPFSEQFYILFVFCIIIVKKLWLTIAHVVQWKGSMDIEHFLMELYAIKNHYF